jgi:hypothetical protein
MKLPSPSPNCLWPLPACPTTRFSTAKSLPGTPVGGRALPFSTLQQRLGRKKVSAKLMREVPVAYLVFDILYADGQLLLDHPLRDRANILDKADEEPGTAGVRHGSRRDGRPRVQPNSAPAAAQSQAQFAFAAPELPRDNAPRSGQRPRLLQTISKLCSPPRAIAATKA